MDPSDALERAGPCMYVRDHDRIVSRRASSSAPPRLLSPLARAGWQRLRGSRQLVQREGVERDEEVVGFRDVVGVGGAACKKGGFQVHPMFRFSSITKVTSKC